MARFGGGLDIFFAPRFGVYAEGAYMLAPSDIPTGGSFPDYWTFGAGGLIAF